MLWKLLVLQSAKLGPLPVLPPGHFFVTVLSTCALPLKVLVLWLCGSHGWGRSPPDLHRCERAAVHLWGSGSGVSDGGGQTCTEARCQGEHRSENYDASSSSSSGRRYWKACQYVCSSMYLRQYYVTFLLWKVLNCLCLKFGKGSTIKKNHNIFPLRIKIMTLFIFIYVFIYFWMRKDFRH